MALMWQSVAMAAPSDATIGTLLDTFPCIPRGATRSKYLDGSYANLQFGQQPVRLFHLINHRSGLPFILPNPPQANPQFDSVANSSRHDFYAALGKVELTAAPGAQFAYSNASAQLAGDIVERVYGRMMKPCCGA